jgi:hypothetical protein
MSWETQSPQRRITDQLAAINPHDNFIESFLSPRRITELFSSLNPRPFD